MPVIDSDGHVEEWAETFDDKYFDPAYRDRKPAIVGYGSRACWLIDSQAVPRFTGRGCHVLGTPTGFGTVPTPFTTRKPDSIESMELRGLEARLATMDQEGIDASILYPSLFLCYPLTTDPGLQNALCRSYNNWMADKVNGADRFRWVAVVPADDPKAAAAEVRRATAELGAIGVMVLGSMAEKQLDHPDVLPFWEACAEQDTAVAVHVGWSNPILNHLYDELLYQTVYPFLFPVLMAFGSITGSGLLDRFPDLRIGFFEAGSMWLHFVAERLDHRYRYVTDLASRMPVKRPGAQHFPSEYLKQSQLYITAEVEDALLPQVVDLLGQERIMWASDIPHGDREPFAVRELEARTDLTAGFKQQMLWDNTLRFYRLDPRKIGRIPASADAATG